MIPPSAVTPSPLGTLRAAFQANRLTQAEVRAAAQAQGLTLPPDFFGAPPLDTVRSAIAAAPTFAPTQGAATTGAAREAQLRTAASPRPRTLPDPAPALIHVGKMVLKRRAQTPDMILYINYINGRPTLVYVMGQLAPSTMLAPNSGFASGRRGLVLADRDGVVKDSRFLNSSDKEEAAEVMIPSALQAAQKLDAAGIGLALVTNQGGYEAGKTSFDEMVAINVRVSQQLANAGGHLDAIFICPFSSPLKNPAPGAVDARKPSPGMVLYARELAERRGIPTLAMAGDQRTDGAAAQGGGLKFYAVTDTTGRWSAELVEAQRRGEALPSLNTNAAVYAEVTTFADAVTAILAPLPTP